MTLFSQSSTQFQEVFQAQLVTVKDYSQSNANNLEMAGTLPSVRSRKAVVKSAAITASPEGFRAVIKFSGSAASPRSEKHEKHNDLSLIHI